MTDTTEQADPPPPLWDQRNAYSHKRSTINIGTPAIIWHRAYWRPVDAHQSDDRPVAGLPVAEPVTWKEREDANDVWRTEISGYAANVTRRIVERALQHEAGRIHVQRRPTGDAGASSRSRPSVAASTT